MKKTFLILLGLIISHSTFASEVFLKQDVTVQDEYIKLSDIFMGITAEQDKKIAPAPAPGKKSYFDFETLYSIAKRSNINWKPHSEFEKTSIIRAYQIIDATEIIEAIKNSDYFSEILSGDETIESRTLSSVNIPEGSNYFIDVVNGNYNDKNNSFRAEINITDDGRILDSIRVVGKIYTMIEVPVLKENISSKAIISENDLSYIKVRSNEVNQKSLIETSAIVGKEAKKTLKAGEILTENDVKTPVLVTKSKMVKVIYKKKNLTLNYVGKALDDGSYGDFVRFQSATSTNVLQGLVVATNTLLVGDNQIPNEIEEKR